MFYRSFKSIAALVVLAGALLFSGTVMAQPGKGKGAAKSHKTERAAERHKDDKDRVTISLGFGDRETRIIRDHLGKHYGQGCPPGLAKKRNGCLPPGQAKKYRVGAALPPWLGWNPLPDDLRDLLGPPPRGHFYGQVDKDVLLISEAGKNVIDAVTLLSALD